MIFPKACQIFLLSIEVACGYKFVHPEKVSAGIVALDLIYDAPSQAYYTELKVGSNGDAFSTLVDTGSSDLWLSDSLFNYNESTTFVENSTEFEMEYATGQISGLWGSDHLVIGNSVIPKQVLGVGTSAPVDMSGVQSILGISYIQDESSQYITDGKFAYPNVPQSLVDNKFTARNVIGVTGSEIYGGELVFGGYDLSQIDTSSLTRFVNLPSGYYNGTERPYYQGFQTTIEQFTVFNQFDKLYLSTNKNLIAFDSGSSGFIMAPGYFDNLVTAMNLYTDSEENTWIRSDSNFESVNLNMTLSGKTFTFPFSIFIEFNITQKINGSTYYFTNVYEYEDSSFEFLFGKDFFKYFYFIADMLSNEIAIGYKKTCNNKEKYYVTASSTIPVTSAPSYSATFTGTAVPSVDVTVSRSLKQMEPSHYSKPEFLDSI